MSAYRCDVAIIGAGLIGLAVGRELLQRWPRLRVVVLEKERAIALHQSGRNSGVIHAGLYYQPGSFKARACVAGSRALMRYCDERGIPYDRCGKVVVATDEHELPRLEELHRRGTANGVKDLELIGPERLREIEPHAIGVRALYSPHTAIVDFTRVAHAYADDLIKAGATILTGHEVVGIEAVGSETIVQTAAVEVHAGSLIVCAGLHADRLAAMTGAPREPRIVPFRGDYYVLRDDRAHLCRSLIYPVPDPAFPFLGVHLTRRMDGSVWLGPNAVLAFAREGYERTRVDLRDLREVLAFGGFRRLAAKYWRTGAEELIRDYSKRLFLKALQRYVPELELSDLIEGPAGVRAQALDADGRLVDDFVIHRSGNVLHVRNAPSPAATSSLEIARYIADAADESFGFARRSPESAIRVPQDVIEPTT